MNFSILARVAGAASLVLAATACDDFLSVENPTVIEASTVDPVADAPTFANSALNNFYVAADNVAVYQAWFTGESWVGDTFPTRNDIAKRQIDFTNGTLSDEVFNPLARAIATGERTLEILAGASGGQTALNTARAAFASGYAIQFTAETFCEVVISSSLENLGAPMSPAEGSAQAAERFRRVITALEGVTGDEASRLRNAANVGLARALLFRGEYSDAIAAAQQVTDATFAYMIPRVDDPSNRGALGNTVYSFTLARPSLVVPPYIRALNDPRIRSALGGSGFPTKTQGNDLDFHRQLKYTEWGADIRLASHLEAQYIIAEARLKQGDPTAALALIAARSIPGTGDGDDFAADPNSTLTELLDQRARDFYLEAQHMGTWLRNPEATPYVYRAGSPYYGQLGAVVGTQTCMPVPDDEVLHNPNFP
jgi:starch-binding outer membrane protein, SusD/RagB family